MSEIASPCAVVIRLRENSEAAVQVLRFVVESTTKLMRSLGFVLLTPLR